MRAVRVNMIKFISGKHTCEDSRAGMVHMWLLLSTDDSSTDMVHICDPMQAN